MRGQRRRSLAALPTARSASTPVVPALRRRSLAIPTDTQKSYQVDDDSAREQNWQTMCEDLQAWAHTSSDVVGSDTPPPTPTSNGKTVEAVEAAVLGQTDAEWQLVLGCCMDHMREYERREWLAELDRQDTLRNGRGYSSVMLGRWHQKCARSAAYLGRQDWQDYSTAAGLEYIE
ncbi:hypothetical protein C8R44DRAFT_891307 [Mycena epipterygia]|nr:hypothetical protein C8R44DRAFT_891307 [Mycena epipterygia]